jgi:hypothetical protein
MKLPNLNPYFRFFLPVLIASCSWSHSAQAADDAERVRTLLQGVVDYRSSIPSGSASIFIEREGQATLQWHTWFDGENNFRFDDAVKGKSYLQNREYYFEYHLNGEVLPTLRPLHHPNNLMLNMRLLGVIGISTTALPTVENFQRFEVLGQSDHLSVETIEYNDRPVSVVTSDMGGGQIFKIWIDEQRGPSVIRSEIQSQWKETHILSTMTCDLTDIDGIWYPRIILYWRTIGGFRSSEQKTTLKDVSFNGKGFSDEIFSLKVPVGCVKSLRNAP